MGSPGSPGKHRGLAIHRQFDLVDLDAFGSWGHLKDALEVVRPGQDPLGYHKKSSFFYHPVRSVSMIAILKSSLNHP